MTRYHRQLYVPPDDINAVHEFLQIIWSENPHIPSRDRFCFETAIIELAANIILYSVAVSGVTCQIVIETNDEQIDAIISDNGELVDLEFDEHLMPDEYSETGRGIPLMRALVDEFSFNTAENRNTWKMSKRFEK